MRAKKMLSLGLAAVMGVSALGFAGCGSDGGESADSTFSWWVYTDDGAGTY